MEGGGDLGQRQGAQAGEVLEVGHSAVGDAAAAQLQRLQLLQLPAPPPARAPPPSPTAPPGQHSPAAPTHDKPRADLGIGRLHKQRMRGPG